MNDKPTLPKLFRVEFERTYRVEAYVVAESYGVARARMLDADVVERLHETGERTDHVDVLEITPEVLRLHTERTGNRQYLFSNHLPHSKNCYYVGEPDDKGQREQALVTVAEGHKLAGLIGGK